MSERVPDNRRRWKALSSDVAAAYEPDALGDMTLAALVIHGPTAAKMRGLKMRELERVPEESVVLNVIYQYEPPTAEAVAALWRNTGLWNEVIVEPFQSRYSEWLEEQIAKATTREELSRRDGEQPEDFYRRIARAYALLEAATKRPKVELARRAGVSEGTAGAWVNRAKARGLFDGILDDEGEQ